ncbi:AAA family ATPase [Allochromatium humboldtianum]|uniref:AAA family ATPase n=1 Tax=Allochromatium humboldtianum TaxID=504901 RepID=A0A850RGB2_9GAMM|nr:AAA family ATPase [Allochromatium humboldtianum]NVZ10447.1 AAA family ATPase [Allochromatium humboldtianum]
MTTQLFNVGQTFGVKAPAGLVIEGFSATDHPLIPPATPYVFRQGLAALIAFLRDPAGDAFLLTGPTGSGKTSLVCQVAARLNWPVQSVTCHGRLELSDLVGQFVLIDGSTRFVHGPLAVALREGHLLLLNEIDLMDPAELAGLNDVIEGQPLVIAQNGGEVIRPHPKFRVFATGNSAGAGDTTGLYQGVLRQNLAFLDRFRVLPVGYLEPEVELGVLAGAVPSLPPEVGEKLIAVANEVRRLFVGEGESTAQLTITLSTRTLVRWARLALTFRGAPQPIRFALEQALTARADPDQREAIHRVAADVMGDLWTGSSAA